MEVTRDAPPPGQQQDARVHAAVGRPVRGVDDVRLATPHETVPVGASHFLLLLVGQVVDDDRSDAAGEDQRADDGAESDGVVHEIHRHGRVQAGDERQAAPADVESGAVQHDIDGAHVARLPPEELGEVDHLQRSRHPHSVDEAGYLVTLQGEYEHQQRPDGHAETTVGEYLHVDTEHSRVQLRAPVIVEDRVTCRAAVRGARVEETLQVQSDTQKMREDG